MTLFGKDPKYLEVVAADFLPNGNKLYMLVADSDCNLHVLQYDPEGVSRIAVLMRTLLTFRSRPQILQWRPTAQPEQILHGQLRLNGHPIAPHCRLV